MLPGNENVSFAMSLQIALVGMCIVMLELAILSFFVLILSKVMANFSAKNVAVVAPTTQVAAAPIPTMNPVVATVQENEDEIAAVMIAVAEESGYSLNEIVFKSIEEKK